MDWRHRASCRDEDPETWFPVGDDGPALLQIAEAKTVCQRCPVTTQCLDMALAEGLDHGVFGGMSRNERRALRRSNGPTGQRREPVEAVQTVTVTVDLVAVAAEGAACTTTVRWHPLEDSIPGCGTPLTRVMTRPAREIPAARRCRQPRCRRLWQQVDAALEATGA